MQHIYIVDCGLSRYFGFPSKVISLRAILTSFMSKIIWVKKTSKGVSRIPFIRYSNLWENDGDVRLGPIRRYIKGIASVYAMDSTVSQW